MSDKPNQHGGRRPGAGRPRGDNTATERVEFRATPDEVAAWRAAAGDEPLSAWIRDRCNRAAARR